MGKKHSKIHALKKGTEAIVTRGKMFGFSINVADVAANFSFRTRCSGRNGIRRVCAAAATFHLLCKAKLSQVVTFDGAPRFTEISRGQGPFGTRKAEKKVFKAETSSAQDPCMNSDHPLQTNDKPKGKLSFPHDTDVADHISTNRRLRHSHKVFLSCSSLAFALTTCHHHQNSPKARFSAASSGKNGRKEQRGRQGQRPGKHRLTCCFCTDCKAAALESGKKV
ncbi:uncharacterized protein LOC140702826 isoform X1 [Pogona vitticeps]